MSAPTNARMTLIDIGRPGDPSVFSSETLTAAHEIVARYPAGQSRSALLPMLHLVQSEQGYVSADGIAFCAEVLDITKAQVAAVATFYTMYKRKPTGEYLVSVCTNTLCGLLGGDEIYATLSELLGVGMNGTTSDGKITLEHAECLAACDYAPVVTVNYEFFDNQSVESATGLVQELQGGSRPLPSRGAPLCTFKEISRQIAGFVDSRPESESAKGTGVPTEAGVKLAADKKEVAPAYPAGSAPTAGEPAKVAPAKAAPAKVAPAKSAPAKAAPAKATAASSAPAEQKAAHNTGAQSASSANDAPLQTADSDPAADGAGSAQPSGKGE